VWRTERGRGEPPTLHDPHTPVVRSVTRTRDTCDGSLLSSRAYETAGSWLQTLSAVYSVQQSRMAYTLA
jgi:hypothetical protein